MKFLKHILLFSLALVLNCSALADKKPVKVFILAGQSNMEGKGRVDPLLNHQITAPETKDFFAHLHKDGKYIERDDVCINYLKRRGKLTVGYGSPGRIGLEEVPEDASRVAGRTATVSVRPDHAEKG